MRSPVEWGKLPVLKTGRKILIKSDILEKFTELNEGKDLLGRSKAGAVIRKAALKKAASLEAALRYVSDRN